jgi:hypothetical protein
MPTGLISDLYDELFYLLENDSKSVLDFFAKNALVFNNLKTFSNKEDLNRYIVLAGWYADSLNKKDRYNDTFGLINRVLPIIDSEIARLNTPELKNDWYYFILFLKGTSSYNLHDFKTAIPIFKYLVKHDPQNEKYRNWLRHAVFRKTSRIVIVIYILCGLLLFFQIISKGFGWYSYTFTQTVSIIGLLTALSTVLYEYYLKRNLRKSKIS